MRMKLGALQRSIPEKVLRDHGDGSCHAAFPARVEAVQRQLGADHLCGRNVCQCSAVLENQCEIFTCDVLAIG